MQKSPLTPSSTEFLNIKGYADKIIFNRTLPPQLDYVPPSDKRLVDQGFELINSLPDNKRQIWFNYIERKVDDYYTTNEQGYSMADLDAMF